MKLTPQHFGAKRPRKPELKDFTFYDRVFVRGKEVFKEVPNRKEWIKAVDEWKYLKKKFYKWEQRPEFSFNFFFSKRNMVVWFDECGGVGIEISDVEHNPTSLFFAKGLSVDLFDIVVFENK